MSSEPHCLPFYHACLRERFFLFPCLNSFPWQQALQTHQWFLCAKWISVKRLRWNLSNPGDQIDPGPAQDEADQSLKVGNAKSFLSPTQTHSCRKVKGWLGSTTWAWSFWVFSLPVDINDFGTQLNVLTSLHYFNEAFLFPLAMIEKKNRTKRIFLIISETKGKWRKRNGNMQKIC